VAFRGGVRGATIKPLDVEAALAFLRRRPDASAFTLRWIKPPGSAFGGGNCCTTFDVAFNFGGGRAFVVALVVAVVAANLGNAGGGAGGDGGTALPRAAAIAELLSITSSMTWRLALESALNWGSLVGDYGGKNP
jgi:hypothetical protein